MTTDPERTLRWGLLSTARINRALIPPLRASGRNELAAVASRSPERARSYAEKWQIPKWHGRYEDLLADPEIDVVYISLPNHLHAEWTIRCVEAGKHVLCEKPLALTVVDADAMAAAASRAGVVLAEAFMYRHHARTLRVKELIDSGIVGALRLIRGSFSFPLSDPSNVRLDPAKGGGSLWDVGCYPVSYARFLTGAEPEQVYGQQIVGPTGVDVQFAGQLAFPDGVIAQFDSGFNLPHRMHMTVVGSEGTLEIPEAYKPGPVSHVVVHRDGELDTRTIDGRVLYLDEIEDLADAVLTGAAPRVSLAESRANTATLVALYRSAREGRPVAPVH